LQSYGSKGLAIFQVINDGIKQGMDPDADDLANWVSSYTPAGTTGIDPRARSAKFYLNGSPTVSIPYNIIIDAKTRKILEKEVSYTNLETTIQTYLQ
jgi:hypothetical protein